MKKITVLLALAACLCTTSHASDGNEIFAIGAVHKSMGGAGVASPQDATWALINPASITQLDSRLDSSFELFFLKASSHPRGNPLAANPFAGEMEIEFTMPIPAAGAIFKLKTGTLGIGAYGIQGNSADFPHPRTTVSLFQNEDRRSSYHVVRMPIAYAYEFENGWSLGAAVVPVATRFLTDSITLRLRPTEGDAKWRYAFGAGFQLGVYKRWDKVSIGANYSSRVWMEDYSDYSSDLVTHNLDLPQKVQLGIAWRPAKKWELVADYKWTEWSDTNLFGEPTIRGGLGWRNQHVYKLGAIYDVAKDWTLRAGVTYGRTPIREEFVFANAISPALANWHLATGLTRRIGKHHELHASYSYVIPESMTESGNGDIFSRLAKGTKTSYGESSITVQYSYKF